METFRLSIMCLKQGLLVVMVFSHLLVTEAQIWGTPMLAEEIGGRGSNMGLYPEIEIVNGKPAIVYWDATHGNLMYVRAEDATGSTWSLPIVIDLPGMVGANPSFEIVNGFPAVSYVDYLNWDLKYIQAKDSDGIEWFSPVLVDSGFDVGLYGSLNVVNGYPAISYFDGSNNDLMFIRANDANGFSWSTPKRLDSPGIVGLYTSLQIINGNPAIAYHQRTDQFKVKYIRALDANGSTWTQPVTLDQVPDCIYPSMLAVDGNPSVAYLDGTNGDLKFIRSSDLNGSQWSTPVRIDSAGVVGYYPSLELVTGRPAIAYYDQINKNLKYVRSTNASGTQWGNSQIIDAVGDVGIEPSLKIVDGNPAIAYYDNTNGYLKFVRAQDAFGETWNTPVNLEENGATGQYVNLELVKGKPAIASFGNTDLRYTRATNAAGTAWSKPLVLDADGYVGQYTSMQLISGKPAIAYFDATRGRAKYVRAVDSLGTSWGVPVIIPAGLSGTEGYLTSLAEVQENPAVVYTNSSIGRIIYKRADDPEGTSWSTQYFFSGEVQGLGDFKSLSVVNGRPAFSFRSINGQLKYVRALDALGTNWSEPLLLDATNGSGAYPSLSTINGHPAISYSNRSSGDLLYIRAADPDGNTWNAPIVIDVSGYGKYTSLKVIDGYPAISYYDNDTKFVKYVRALDISGTTWGSPVSLAKITPDNASTGDYGVYTSMIPMQDGAGIAYFNEIENFPFFIAGIKCRLPVLNSISTSNNLICQGDSIGLSLEGTLNDALNWQWYSASCGGIPAGTGSSLSAMPDSFTMYYVRGEGGCVPVSMSPCSSVTVWVTTPPAKPIIQVATDEPEGIKLITSGGTSYQWYYNEDAIAGATDSVYWVTTEGSYSVSAEINTCWSELSENHVIEITGFLVGESRSKPYPNPTHDFLTIPLKSTLPDTEHSIQIKDFLGRTIEELKGAGPTIRIDTKGYPPGNYFIIINRGKGQELARFIKS